MHELPARLVDAPDRPEPSTSPKAYRGFVAGIFSGIAKLSGMSLSLFLDQALSAAAS